MGVPKFYRWTSERYPCLSEVINETQIPEFDNLYLDMNGIIHNCSHPNDDDVTFRITEEEIFVNIFAYIENLFNLIRPQKVFFMAVDGVAPRAKMNQQRARRFMSARTAEAQMRQAVEKGEVIPSEKRFDSNCITPGTYFMTKLHEKLEDWIRRKSTSDSRWHGKQIILSGHNVPGEGEHKIMDYIRAERAKSNYDPNTRHCMYGLDADLIMLGIVSHEPHFSLLREEVTFNSRPRKHDQKNKKPQRTDSDAKKFHLLHLSLLREYLAWEFAGIKDSLPFAYDMERIVDDWILMGLLVGNDFLPHLPNIHIHDDALPLLYSTYKKCLPTLDGYINEGGYLNLGRFEKFLAILSLNDKNCFMDKMEDEQFMESKKSGNYGQKEEKISEKSSEEEEDEEELVPFESSDIEDEEEVSEEEDDGSEAAFVSDHEQEEQEDTDEKENEQSSSDFDALLLEEEYNDQLATLALSGMSDADFANNVEACWTKTMENQFKRHKKSYYSDKMKYKNISKTELRAQAEGYVRAIQWNLHYYYHGCVSWSWFYPHHYAPYISDVTNFSQMKIEFELSEPFRPFEQLLAVLPEASSDCLPRPLQELMSSDPTKSPISEFYPASFETDLNGKRNDWEAVVLIPFIDENRLLEAIETKKKRLTQEENRRNNHGSHVLVISHSHSDGEWISTRTELAQDLFRIPKEQVKWGLLPNVKMDVYFPGFPTMKHLTHHGDLRFANCNIFGMASRKESMVLKVEMSEENQSRDIVEWGSVLCDEEVCIDWPILKLAKVESIWGGDDRIVRKSDDEIVVKDMTDEEKRQWSAHVNHLTEHQMTRYAIEIAGQRDSKGKHIRPPIVWVRKFTGLVYETQLGKHGQPPVLKAVKQWSSPQSAFPVLLPLVVKDVLLESSRHLSDLPIRQAFPKQSIVWLTDPSMELFGMPGMVSDYTNEKSPNCKIQVVGMVTENRVTQMEALRKKADQKSLRWMGGYDCARQCHVDTRLFARMTGTVFLWNEPREKVEKGQQISSESKINCGLALKFSKRDICLADYTDRIEQTNHKGVTNKIWVYTTLTCRLVNEYRQKFPEVWKYLESASQNVMDDVYYTEDIWPENQRNERFAELKEFLGSLASHEAEHIKCSTPYADRNLIHEIELLLKEKIEAQPMMRNYTLPPSSLFRYDLYDGKVMADPEADFQILDRVAMMSQHAKVPKVVQGTVVGVHGEKVDVLFDQNFPGGSRVRGSDRTSAFRAPASAFFNVTFGLIRKKGLQKKQAEKVLDGAYVPIPQKKANKAPTVTQKPEPQPSTSTASAPSKSAQKSAKNQKKFDKKGAEKSEKSEKNEKNEKKTEKIILKKSAPPPEISAEALTNSLNQMLKIKPMTSSSSSSEAPPPSGKPVSLIELLGGKASVKKPEVKTENSKKPSILEQLQEAQQRKSDNEKSTESKKKSAQKSQKKEPKTAKKQQEEAPPTSKPAPSTSQQAPPTSKQAPPTSEQAPPIAQQAPPTSQQAPPTSQQAPPTYQQAPPPGAPFPHMPIFGAQMYPMGFMGPPPMGMHMNQQNYGFDGKRANPSLTDFKPSAVTRPNHHPSRKFANKPKPVVEESRSEEPQTAPSTSTVTQEEATPTTPTAKKVRKQKKSRLGVNFCNPTPSN